MGLHRLFCIPHGSEASQGVYLRYPAEELYAIVCLESQRHRAAIVGENLGTVPSAVNKMMQSRDIQPMHVLQYELPATLEQPLAMVPDNAVASVNTHDFSPFSAFWQGGDLQDRLALGLLDQTSVKQEERNLRRIKSGLVTFLRDNGWLNGPRPNTQAVLGACLAYLAASPAQVVLVSLEDLWGELLPQNIPNTGPEKPNWRRKTRDPFEVWSQQPEVLEVLRSVQHWREQADTSREK
jgi:4-alpha-glucanotransferase